MTMTYGPATLTELVADGTYPRDHTCAPLDEGTVGNASFLAIPSSAGDPEGAMVVANLALSPAAAGRSRPTPSLGPVHGARHRTC